MFGNRVAKKKFLVFTYSIFRQDLVRVKFSDLNHNVTVTSANCPYIDSEYLQRKPAVDTSTGKSVFKSTDLIII